MNHKETAEKLLQAVEQTKAEFLKLKDAEVQYLSTVLKDVKADVLQCETEDDLLKLLAEIGDQLYKGNAITEAVDGPVLLLALRGADRFILDKFFGADWFANLKKWVAAL